MADPLMRVHSPECCFWRWWVLYGSPQIYCFHRQGHCSACNWVTKSYFSHNTNFSLKSFTACNQKENENLLHECKLFYN